MLWVYSFGVSALWSRNRPHRCNRASRSSCPRGNAGIRALVSASQRSRMRRRFTASFSCGSIVSKACSRPHDLQSLGLRSKNRGGRCDWSSKLRWIISLQEIPQILAVPNQINRSTVRAWWHNNIPLVTTSSRRTEKSRCVSETTKRNSR